MSSIACGSTAASRQIEMLRATVWNVADGSQWPMTAYDPERPLARYNAATQSDLDGANLTCASLGIPSYKVVTGLPRPRAQHRLGIVMPSAFAVLRFSDSSSLLGC